MPRSLPIILLSLALHAVLILYADHVDSHPERYGGLKYTDVDWRVVVDGAQLIFALKEGEEAKGWAVEAFGLVIGDPYNRATFRYNPLLPLLLSPALILPLLGKLLLSGISLAVGPLLLYTARLGPQVLAGKKVAAVPTTDLFWPIHLLWTLNPFVLNITTRGSPEAVVVLLVAGLIACLRAAEAARGAGGPIRPAKWEDRAAIMLALSISYKIYPVIYVPSIWANLAKRHGWLGWKVWRFGFVSAATLLLVNGILWSIWGQPFLDHTFFYHLTRLDHRHNFSPYYYPIYLSLFPSDADPRSALAPLLMMLRHPVTSFLPQATLVLGVGLILTPRTGLGMAMFVQTTAFVIFNKVCTSQYFMWWIPLLPLVLPDLRVSTRKAAVLLAIWVAGQALWLSTAYQLELMARSVHLYLWAAGVTLFMASVWVLGEVIEGWEPPGAEASQAGVSEMTVREKVD